MIAQSNFKVGHSFMMMKVKCSQADGRKKRSGSDLARDFVLRRFNAKMAAGGGCSCWQMMRRTADGQYWTFTNLRGTLCNTFWCTGMLTGPCCFRQTAIIRVPLI